MLGGGGLIAANVYASATEDGATQSGTDQVLASGAATIDCPDVGSRLTTVPDPARPDVDRELAVLDQQIADAYQRLREAQAAQQDGDSVDGAIMNPLQEDRAATIERIARSIDGAGDRPDGLDTLAACELRAPEAPIENGDQNGQDQAEAEDGEGQAGQEQEQQEDQGGGDQPAGNGPVAGDYADITAVQPDVPSPARQANASRGTFTTSCGVNENGLFNSDNVIVAPGVTNGAHHFHDYIGNQANDAFASDDDLAAADTSCEDQGDKSTYYWPVLRLQNGVQEQDANAPGGGIEGNAGEIVTPKQVTLTFVGSPQSEVTAMPRFLRVITGDAKAFVNGTANANASWSCTGFEDRQLKDKYPLCPQGSDVVRTFKFQSCWDGQNIDSANHRTHVAFAAADGSCPSGFQAIPQLVQRIVYDVDAPSLDDGGRTTPLFAVDSFPEQLHKPVTDHGDFINVFDEDLMTQMVDCINGGRQCGAGADPGAGDGSGEEPGQPSPPADDPEEPAPPADEPEQPSPPADEPEKPSPGADDPAGGDNGGAAPGDPGNEQPPAEEPGTEPENGAANPPADADEPKAYATPSPEQSDAAAPAEAGGGQDEEIGDATQQPVANDDGSEQQASGQTEPQTVGGGLAETGAQLWPAAAGAVLVICGLLLLRRMARDSA
ncbi:DUF1996 domain-containing protein [Streptomyces blattellae]|uniref:DUF1996 domain-containing protein n=1 Tax=Streptomyces blattellae TaxID=2569855 RepID=UPI0012B8B557|nr:DUF1996 domain-containing protein [Streptomyces blattellae]